MTLLHAISILCLIGIAALLQPITGAWIWIVIIFIIAATLA